MLEILFHGHIIEDLNGEQYFGTYYEKELQKTNQSCDKIYMSNGKFMTIHLIVGLVKEIILQK